MTQHEDEHLRRFVAARERGDAMDMRRWWEEVVIDLFDRVEGLVHLQHRGRLDDDEHETAVSLALLRIATNLMTTFRGTSMGELVNAVKTLVRGICIDVQRRSTRRHERSLDEGWDAGGDEPAPVWEAHEARLRHDADQRAADARDFLTWALPQLSEDRRRVVELTFAGADADAIAEELGITRDNAYQRRTRAFRDLRTLKGRFDA